jgi:dTMP kinase
MRGRFITFEGGEGAGKSTQIARLKRRLEALGHRVLATREPGGSEKSEAIRRYILSGRAKALGAGAEALLFYAARLDHLETLIRPALAEGMHVLSDRFADSTRAYQGAAGEADRGLLDALDRIVVDGTQPDLTIVLDLPAEIGLARARSRRGGEGADRFEAEEAAFHEALRRGFRGIAAGAPARCAIVDATAAEDAVAETIFDLVRRRLPDLAKLVPATADVA